MQRYLSDSILCEHFLMSPAACPYGYSLDLYKGIHSLFISGGERMGLQPVLPSRFQNWNSDWGRKRLSEAGESLTHYLCSLLSGFKEVLQQRHVWQGGIWILLHVEQPIYSANWLEWLNYLQTTCGLRILFAWIWLGMSIKALLYCLSATHQAEISTL